jgi:protein-S-isoprenylcysteine O-methyltransferase Ste14
MSRVAVHAAELVVILDFALVAALPRIFFRAGSFNARWLLTATPFALAAGAVLGAWLGVWSPEAPWGWLPYLGVGLALVSVHLVGLAVGANRVPLCLWHQDDDAPVEIVTWGPYAWVRHPFYAAFLAAFAAAVAVAPGLPTVLPAIAGFVAMAATARREERRLLASPLGGTTPATPR